MMCICAVDVGLTGALAFYFPDAPDRVAVEDIPVVNGRIAPSLLHERIVQMQPDMAIVELVSSRPGQGVVSVFKFGDSFGAVKAAIQIAGIQMHFVTPGKWKKYFGLGPDKEQARELAIRMFSKTPEHFKRKKDHNRAEAALLALYAAQNILKDAAA